MREEPLFWVASPDYDPDAANHARGGADDPRMRVHAQQIAQVLACFLRQ
jgi:hypothetical protein